MSHRFSKLTRRGLFTALACASFSGEMAAAEKGVTPELSGQWARNSFRFEPPLSGPGPVRRLRLPNDNANAFVGDYSNPILGPEAAERVKENGELQRRGIDYPT